MAASALPPLISSDGHLEVRPERWSPRMPAKYRDGAPKTIKLEDGGDALVVEGQPPYPAPFRDLRAGRTNETWQPFGATVDDPPGAAPPERRVNAAGLDVLPPVNVGLARLGPWASQRTFEYRGANLEVLAKLGPRKIVEWVALPFLGTAPSMSFAQLILSGVFDRLPDLQIFFAETRLGWVPFWMEEADYWYERHRHWAERLLNFKPLKQRPSDYVRQHIHFSVQHVERVAIELRHHMGVDHVMFATDFPHIECDWPNTRPFAERLFAGVPAGEAFKIAAGNMLKFFHLEDTPVGRAVGAG